LDMQSNVLHARLDLHWFLVIELCWQHRFLQSRILLFRTTFIQLCQDAVSKPNEGSPNVSTDSEFDVDTFFMTRGAASCVASARELLKLIHRTYLSASSDAWWYNVYCKLTFILDTLALWLIIYSGNRCAHSGNGCQTGTTLPPPKANCNRLKPWGKLGPMPQHLVKDECLWAGTAAVPRKPGVHATKDLTFRAVYC
jgi:hypothetical protein